MSKEKLIKVIFEYEDGRIEYLDGKDAHEWYKAANAMAVMESVHGRPFPQFTWKRDKKKKRT